jgi:hypothetical protein
VGPEIAVIKQIRRQSCRGSRRRGIVDRLILEKVS